MAPYGSQDQVISTRTGANRLLQIMMKGGERACSMMTKGEVHEAIDRLTDEQLRPVATLIEELLPHHNSLWEGLKSVPGIRLPRQWPPRFGPVERLRSEGKLASDEVIRTGVDRLLPRC